jgi:hypothetical protein
MPADSAEHDAPLPLSVRLLQWLVIVMTVTMIAGVITIVAVVVTRLQHPAPYPALPETLALPPGTEAEAVTFGRGFVIVVTRDGQLLVLDRATGALRQTVALKPAP